jgi:radical SAM superfamily enzyme YgiQ (UPF0313 family)
VWGGVHVTTNPDDCLKYADYICLGEGERAIVSLLEHLRDKGRDMALRIPGVRVAAKAGQEDGLPASVEMDLDSLPCQEYLPVYYYGFHKGEVHNFSEKPKLFRRYALYGGTNHMMITTRGCPYNCGYCANSSLAKVYGRKVRTRSVENCMEELKKVKKDPFVLYVNFQDDCFFIHDREWIRKFCREYKEHINLPFMVRAIPTLLDREKLFMLRDAGLSVVIMGIQSGSDRVNLDIYGRKVRFASVKEAADLISQARALPYYEMIVDNPYETEHDMIETIHAMSGIRKPYTISLAHLTFFPGTPLTQKALEDNIVDPEAYMFRYMVNIDYTYLNKVLYLAPYVSRVIVRYLARPASERRLIHRLLTDSLFFLVKRTFEPLVYIFLIARSLNYNVNWTGRTVICNWRSALSKLLSNFLSRGDMEYHKRLVTARKEMPSLFKR